MGVVGLGEENKLVSILNRRERFELKLASNIQTEKKGNEAKEKS